MNSWLRQSSGFVAGLADSLGLLNLHHRREELADLLGQVRVAVGVFRDRRPFAAAKAFRELLRQLIQQIIIPSEFDVDIVQNPSRPPGIAARIVLSFLSARM